MVEALQAHTRQVITAVGSRSQDRADQFAATYGIEHAFGSYEQLVACDDVDIVYVASPHSEHAEHALLALNAGKPTLVEKAFTRNRAEAEQVVAAARAAHVPVMEAIMTRHTPALDIVRQLIEGGDLGEVDTILADHGQNLVHVPRVILPQLAGGALLDLGIYCVQLAVFLGGLPQRVLATGALTETGVDAHESFTFTGLPKLPLALAAMHTTMLSETPTVACIAGSLARVELGSPFTTGGVDLRYTTVSGEELYRPTPAITGSDSLCHEAVHFAQLVADGATDSPVMPADESVAIMGILDDIRAQVGLKYPGE